MSTHQDVPQTFHKYDSDDRKILVDLLHEYSGKLLESSRVISKKKISIKDNIRMMLFLLGAACIDMIAIVFIIIQPTNSSLNGLFFTVFTTFVMLLICFLIMSLNNNNFLQKTENGLLEKDTRMIVGRLESAIRLTVEITDQVETNLAKKLELDSRIDEASYALEYYYSVVKSKV